jgi:iron complex outermembrane receptor protein
MNFRLYRIVVGVALSSVVAIIAMAEESDVSFVVTASRSEESPALAPAQIEVITAEKIAQSGADSVVDLLSRVAGVQFSSALSGPGSESVSMRGFGENSFGRVLVLVDGTRLNNPDMQNINWNSIALSDIERIEVVDGSASVEYGNTAVGGVINIITKKHVQKPETSLGVLAGSFYEEQQYLSHKQPVSMGYFSIAADHTGTAGYRDRQGAQTTNVSLHGKLNISDTMSLSLQLAGADLQYQLPGGLTREEFEANPTQAKNWNDAAHEYDGMGQIGFEWLPSEQLQCEVPLSYTVKNITADMSAWSNFTNRLVQTVEARPKLTTIFPVAGNPVRLVSGIDLYGAFLDIDEYSNIQHSQKSGGHTVNQETGGAYLTARMDIVEVVRLTAGLRYDMAAVQAQDGEDTLNDTIIHTAFVYEGGITYQPYKNFKVYASYETLFRYPFIDEQVEVWPTLHFNTGLEPETGFNTEAGVSLDIGKTFQFHGNLYYMCLDNEIAYNMETFKNENMDTTQRFGTNISLIYAPFSYVTLATNYSYVHATYREGPNSENIIPLVPAHRGSIQILCNTPGGLSFGPTALYRSAAYQGGDYNNTLEKIKGFIEYGATVSLALQGSEYRLNIQGSVTNLLNTSYAPLIYYSAYYPADGRTFKLSLKLSF